MLVELGQAVGERLQDHGPAPLPGAERHHARGVGELLALRQRGQRVVGVQPPEDAHLSKMAPGPPHTGTGTEGGWLIHEGVW